MRWRSSSQPEEVIPASAFGKGLDVTYSCEQPAICYTTKGDTLYAIALDYPQDVLSLEIPKPQGKLEITLLGSDKVLPYKYKSGHLIIDTRKLQYADLRSTAAWVFRIVTLP